MHGQSDMHTEMEPILNLQAAAPYHFLQVTGGSAGIGRAAALAFGANGARVAVMGRRKERLDAVVEHLPTGLAVVGDLTVPEDCKRAVAETVEAFGGLDVLVNNGAQRSCQQWCAEISMLTSALRTPPSCHSSFHCPYH